MRPCEGDNRGPGANTRVADIPYFALYLASTTTNIEGRVLQYWTNYYSYYSYHYYYYDNNRGPGANTGTGASQDWREGQPAKGANQTR